MNNKSEFRLAIKERLTRLSPKDRDIESRVLCKELKRFLGNEPKTITAYMHLHDEPDLEPLLRDLLSAGWTVSLPAIASNLLVFRTIRKISDAPLNQKTHLQEPLEDCPVTDRTKIDYVIVPGRAFTKDGLRLGRGNGGYDRWIADQRKMNPQTKFIGVCFESQILSELPTEPHDEKMDVVVTARGPTNLL